MLYKEEVCNMIGACMEVFRGLGCRFFEALCQEALANNSVSNVVFAIIES